MLQFYFLSILLNLATGCILLYSCEDSDVLSDGKEEESGGELLLSESDGEEKHKKIFGNIFRRVFGSDSIAKDSFFQVVIGVLTVFTGLVKLLSSVDGIFLLGDLLPGAAGLAGGASLLLSYYNCKSEVKFNLPGILEKIFVEGRKFVAIGCIAIAVIHFIVPGVLFL